MTEPVVPSRSWPPCWESYRDDYEMDIEPEPEVTAETVALAQQIRDRQIDEFGPCHIIVSDFNVLDSHLAYVALECLTPRMDDRCFDDPICTRSVLEDAVSCAQVVRQLLEMTEQQRFAVVLMAGGCLPMNPPD